MKRRYLDIHQNESCVDGRTAPFSRVTSVSHIDISFLLLHHSPKNGCYFFRPGRLRDRLVDHRLCHRCDTPFIDVKNDRIRQQGRAEALASEDRVDQLRLPGEASTYTQSAPSTR